MSEQPQLPAAVIDGPLAAVHELAVRSLPSRYRLVGDIGAAVVVAGDVPTLPPLAALPECRGLLTLGPLGTNGRADAETWLAGTARAGISVAVVDPFTWSPAWPAVLGWSGPSVALGRVDLDAGDAAGVESALAHGLAAVRSALGPVEAVAYARETGGGLDTIVVAAGRPVHLFVRRTSVLDQWSRLDLVGPEQHVRFEVAPIDAFATPARAIRYDATGTFEAPPVRETAVRAAWRSLHETLTTGVALGHRADATLADLTARERIRAGTAG